MNMFERFDEIPTMPLQGIQETNIYGPTDNMKTVYPHKHSLRGYNEPP